MTAKIKKEKKSILLENTFLPFGVEMLFSWFIVSPYIINIQTCKLNTMYAFLLYLNICFFLKYHNICVGRTGLSPVSGNNLPSI